MADLVPIPTEPKSLRRAIASAGRALALKCPDCGRGRLFIPAATVRSLWGWMTPLARCSGCGQRFERESGYFLLATWAVNYGFGAVLGLGGAFFLHGPLGLGLVPTLVIVSIALPIASTLAVRHAKAIWMAFDHFWDPPRMPPTDPVNERQPKDGIVSESESAGICADRDLSRRLKRGSHDAAARRGGFV